MGTDVVGLFDKIQLTPVEALSLREFLDALGGIIEAFVGQRFDLHMPPPSHDLIEEEPGLANATIDIDTLSHFIKIAQGFLNTDVLLYARMRSVEDFIDNLYSLPKAHTLAVATSNLKFIIKIALSEERQKNLAKTVINPDIHHQLFDSKIAQKLLERAMILYQVLKKDHALAFFQNQGVKNYIVKKNSEVKFIGNFNDDDDDDDVGDVEENEAGYYKASQKFISKITNLFSYSPIPPQMTDSMVSGDPRSMIRLGSELLVMALTPIVIAGITYFNIKPPINAVEARDSHFKKNMIEQIRFISELLKDFSIADFIMNLSTNKKVIKLIDASLAEDPINLYMFQKIISIAPSMIQSIKNDYATLPDSLIEENQMVIALLLTKIMNQEIRPEQLQNSRSREQLLFSAATHVMIVYRLYFEKIAPMSVKVKHMNFEQRVESFKIIQAAVNQDFSSYCAPYLISNEGIKDFFWQKCDVYYHGMIEALVKEELEKPIEGIAVSDDRRLHVYNRAVKHIHAKKSKIYDLIKDFGIITEQVFEQDLQYAIDCAVPQLHMVERNIDSFVQSTLISPLECVLNSNSEGLMQGFESMNPAAYAVLHARLKEVSDYDVNQLLVELKKVNDFEVTNSIKKIDLFEVKRLVSGLELHKDAASQALVAEMVQIKEDTPDEIIQSCKARVKQLNPNLYKEVIDLTAVSRDKKIQKGREKLSNLAKEKAMAAHPEMYHGAIVIVYDHFKKEANAKVDELVLMLQGDKPSDPALRAHLKKIFLGALEEKLDRVYGSLKGFALSRSASQDIPAGIQVLKEETMTLASALGIDPAYFDKKLKAAIQSIFELHAKSDYGNVECELSDWSSPRYNNPRGKLKKPDDLVQELTQTLAASKDKLSTIGLAHGLDMGFFDNLYIKSVKDMVKEEYTNLMNISFIEDISKRYEEGFVEKGYASADNFPKFSENHNSINFKILCDLASTMGLSVSDVDEKLNTTIQIAAKSMMVKYVMRDLVEPFSNAKTPSDQKKVLLKYKQNQHLHQLLRTTCKNADIDFDDFMINLLELTIKSIVDRDFDSHFKIYLQSKNDKKRSAKAAALFVNHINEQKTQFNALVTAVMPDRTELVDTIFLNKICTNPYKKIRENLMTGELIVPFFNAGTDAEREECAQTYMNHKALGVFLRSMDSRFETNFDNCSLEFIKIKLNNEIFDFFDKKLISKIKMQENEKKYESIVRKFMKKSEEKKRQLYIFTSALKIDNKIVDELFKKYMKDSLPLIMDIFINRELLSKLNKSADPIYMREILKKIFIYILNLKNQEQIDDDIDLEKNPHIIVDFINKHVPIFLNIFAKDENMTIQYLHKHPQYMEEVIKREVLTVFNLSEHDENIEKIIIEASIQYRKSTFDDFKKTMPTKMAMMAAQGFDADMVKAAIKTSITDSIRENYLLFVSESLKSVYGAKTKAQISQVFSDFTSKLCNVTAEIKQLSELADMTETELDDMKVQIGSDQIKKIMHLFLVKLNEQERYNRGPGRDFDEIKSSIQKMAIMLVPNIDLDDILRQDAHQEIQLNIKSLVKDLNELTKGKSPRLKTMFYIEFLSSVRNCVAKLSYYASVLEMNSGAINELIITEVKNTIADSDELVALISAPAEEEKPLPDFSVNFLEADRSIELSTQAIDLDKHAKNLETHFDTFNQIEVALKRNIQNLKNIDVAASLPDVLEPAINAANIVLPSSVPDKDKIEQGLNMAQQCLNQYAQNLDHEVNDLKQKDQALKTEKQRLELGVRRLSQTILDIEAQLQIDQQRLASHQAHVTELGAALKGSRLWSYPKIFMGAIFSIIGIGICFLGLIPMWQFRKQALEANLSGINSFCHVLERMGTLGLFSHNTVLATTQRLNDVKDNTPESPDYFHSCQVIKALNADTVKELKVKLDACEESLCQLSPVIMKATRQHEIMMKKITTFKAKASGLVSSLSNINRLQQEKSDCIQSLRKHASENSQKLAQPAVVGRTWAPRFLSNRTSTRVGSALGTTVGLTISQLLLKK